MSGLTWKELSEITGLHHGTASGVLSVLHKSGRIARLKESRDGCKVYVDVSCVKGRVIESQGRKRCCPHCGGNL
jgi:predicted  nucleic acid-binding Zn ribbon protein